MSQNTDDLEQHARDGRLKLIGHGGLIAAIGLISGIPFVFVILDAMIVWPITISTENHMWGTEHGWRVAHVAGVMNGMLMIISGLTLTHIMAGKFAQNWVIWGLIYTGWGNTIFFHLANLSNNRGASAGYTEKFGEPDIYGQLGYIIGASTIPFTIIAMFIIGICALKKMRA